MTDSLTYADALKILGFQKGRLISLLNTVTSLGLAAWAASALVSGREAAVPLGLYEVKNDIISFASRAFNKVSSQRTATGRFDRSERLAAAHTILVISSFYEALDTHVDLDRLDLNRNIMAISATGGEPPDSYVGLIEVLVRAKLPLPEPHRPYGGVRAEIIEIHHTMGHNLASYLRGTAMWDQLSETRQAELLYDIKQATTTAISHYDRRFAQLAVDNREFAIWASLTETHALGTGLLELTELLNVMMMQSPGNRLRAHLIASYRSALEEPLVVGSQAPEGVFLPQLSEAYINPHFQVGEISPDELPASNSWWAKKPIGRDIQAYLTGYLTSHRATRAPLVVLGEPGSGKSKLTQIIAARLSYTNFLPIRIELRDVTAESMIQAQIEEGIFRALGEHASWHDLLAAAPQALPVVLLDGFDELLQNANTNRYDYLEQVTEFQRRQMSIGHPIAIIVSSRIVVADRVRFPPGSLVLRLLPFGNDQIEHWLQVWHHYNAEPLAARGLVPLTLKAALDQEKLSRQPLLLLMLAIYDAADNSLQRGAELDSSELYENLLMDFALREVHKSETWRRMSDTDQHMTAVRELKRLAIVALAMFVRGQQWIDDRTLDRDLEILFTENVSTEDSGPGLTPSQKATAKFFFVHQSEAHSGDGRARSYEFLHATFGEFLVAWLVARAMRDLITFHDSQDPESTAINSRLNDGYIFAVLSFRCLAERSSIADFLHELLSHLVKQERAHWREFIKSLIRDSLYPHDQRSHLDYQPVRLPVPARLAPYSANLFIILAELADDTISLAEVLGERDLEQIWLSYAHLWKGNFNPAEWAGLRREFDYETGPLFRLSRDLNPTIILFSDVEPNADCEW